MVAIVAGLAGTSLGVAALAGCGEKAPLALTPPGLQPLALAATVSFAELPNAPKVSGLVRATPNETQLGLMYRKEPLRDDEGMLFAFSTDRDHSFWMKNTYIPLDMVFIAADGTVAGVLADVPPESTESRSVGAPSRYVLELRAGWSAAHGLRAGARADIRVARAP